MKGHIFKRDASFIIMEKIQELAGKTCFFTTYLPVSTVKDTQSDTDTHTHMYIYIYIYATVLSTSFGRGGSQGICQICHFQVVKDI